MLWNTVSDASTALFLHRLAAPGFVFLAPLAMRLVHEVVEIPPRFLARLLPAAFSLATLLLLVAWFSPWMLAGMVRTTWGWALVPGPAFAVWGALTSIGIALALGVWIRISSISATQASRQRASRPVRLLAPIAIVGVSTDILLPLIGIQAPRLGSLALALVGATLVWVFWQLGFSRLRSGAFATRILRTLDQVLRMARSQVAPDVRVETDHLGDGLLLCEPQRLKQVLLNLVVNAGQAIGPTGRIRVLTRSDGRSIHTIVEDDSCGMPQDVRERIFDPFFTTKPVGRGTGLGLSIAYEIVRSHGGGIRCESQPGRGSTFHVRLPRIASARLEIVRLLSAKFILNYRSIVRLTGYCLPCSLQ